MVSGDVWAEAEVRKAADTWWREAGDLRKPGNLWGESVSQLDLREGPGLLGKGDGMNMTKVYFVACVEIPQWTSFVQFFIIIFFKLRDSSKLTRINLVNFKKSKINRSQFHLGCLSTLSKKSCTACKARTSMDRPAWVCHINQAKRASAHWAWAHFFTVGWEPSTQKSSGTKLKILHIQLI
jgi:hypothetical protein